MVPTSVTKVVAWTGCAATIGLAVAGIALAIIEPPATAEISGSGGVGLASFEAVVYSAFALLGATVTVAQPRNPIGWMLQLVGLVLAMNTVANHVYFQTVLSGDQISGIAIYLTWFLTWGWILAIVPSFTLIPLLFPTGRPLSARWQPVVWITIAAAVLLWFGIAFVPGPMALDSAVDNPLGIESPAVEVIGLGAFVVLGVLALAAITSVGLRFRRSSGVERQQLKWVALAVALLPVAFSGFGVSDDNLGYAILIGGLLVVVAAVAVAMLRYRLYDIDVVINRTLVYAALTATLAAAYFGVVLLLQFVLSPVTQRSDLAVAGSTLAVAALFGPARRRIQAWVDRRFYRRRYDAARTLSQFSAGLRDEVDLDSLGVELQSVVRETMQPASVGLWLRPVASDGIGR